MANIFQGSNGGRVITSAAGSGSLASSAALSTPAGGFSFTAPPLELNGQNVAGNFNFDFPVAAPASISQAYNFIGSATGAAYSFLGQTDAQTDSYAYGLMALQSGYLNNIGQSFAQSAADATSKIETQGGGLLGLLGF
jgi:hypothetical protein